MPIKSRMSLIMGQIEREHLELFGLEYVVLWSDMVSAQSKNRRGQSKNLTDRIRRE